MTGEQGTLLAAPPDEATPDPEVLHRARRIAARLAMPRPRRDVTARRGVGELASVRYNGGVHGENGCELYALHRDDDRLVMIERWASPAALQTHSTASPALQKLNADLDSKLAAPLDVVVLEPVLGGDPARGQL